jgi:hypothetical protein
MKKTLLLLLTFLSVSSYAQLAMEGFEGNVWPPAGWAVVNEAGTGETWQQSDPSSPFMPPYQGVYAAQIESETMPAGTNAEDWLITPQFTISPNGQMTFYSRLSQAGNQGQTFKVLLSTSANQTDLASYNLLQQWTETQINPAQSAYHQITVNLPQTMVGMQAYVAFVMEGDGGDSWLIDNVLMHEECLTPANLAVTNITGTEAALNWTETGVASSWEVQVVPMGAAPNGIGVMVNSNPYIVTGLISNTCYQYYVRSICMPGVESDWVGPMQFCTLGTCDPTDQCNYTFVMSDTANNGWSGNTMTVSQNGTPVITFEMATSPQSINVPLCDGMPFSLMWNGGGTSSQEVGVSIENMYGQTIYTMAPGTEEPGTLLFNGIGQCLADACYPPFNVQSSVVSTDATITWGGSTNSYIYYLVPHGAPAPADETEGVAVTGMSLELEDLLPNTAYDIYIRTVCPELLGGFINSAWAGPSTFETGAGTIITGTVMLDANGDNVCNGADYFIPNVEILVTINENDPFSIYTTEVGEFVIDSLVNGLNTVTLQVMAPQGFAPQPAVTEEIEVLPGSSIVDMSFCLAMPDEPVLNLSATLVPFGDARPGFPAYYQLIVVNNSPVILDNTLTTIAFNDARLQFVSADDPSTQAGGTITLTLPQLIPFGSSVTSLMFSVMMPPVNVGGEQLDFTISSAMDAGGTAVTATGTLQQIIVNSFDPNDITVHEGPFIVEEQADDYLTYTIRFQNTGTADAINVRLENSLDELLDWETFQPINASHNYYVTRNDGDLTFVFNDIHLPAEQDDEAGSHGQVTYRIKPTSTFGLGDVVSNSAGIFFDFNEPIYTNTATTEVVALGTEEFAYNNVKLYPNPVNDQLNILVSSGDLTAVKVYDLNGREINIAQSANVVDVSALSAGVYIVNVVTTEGTSTHRIIKK